MHPRRSEAIAMRQAGKSFNEISRKLGINKSTLSYMLHEVQLTKAQLDVLDARRKASVKYLIKFMAGLSSEEKRSRGREAGRRAWREHKQQMTANLSRGRAIANLTYRKIAYLPLSKLGVRSKERLGRVA